MADKKITELNNITGADLVNADEFVVVDSSADETKAITFGELKEAFDTSTGFVRITGDTMTGDLTVPNVVVSGNVDGRDVSADGTKIDGIEAGADVTDTANVTAAGALMDSEVTNLAQVKAFDSADYATAAQGTTADSAVQPNDSPTFAGLTTTSDVLFDDNDKAIFGAANDLEIDADSLSSRIAATGILEIVSPNSVSLGGAVAGVPNMVVDPAVGTLFLDSIGATVAVIPNSGLAIESNVDLDVTGTVDATAFVGDGSGLTSIATAAQGSLADSAVQPNDSPTFGTVTADGLTVDTDTLHVDATNNRVGINELSPDSPLHVNGGGVNNVATFESTDATASVKFEDSAQTQGVFVGAKGDDFYVQAGGNEKVRLLASGNVGIGTQSPATKLDVDGTVTATALDLGNWTVTESSGVLYFATGGVNKMKLESGGDLTVVGNITAYGTI